MSQLKTDEIRRTILECLLEIAPEADLMTLRADRSLRDQLDIDSFDFLNLLVAIHGRLGVSVPEADYAKVTTLEAMTAYLVAARVS